MAIDRSVKPYSRIALISAAFKIVNTNVLEAEQRKQLQAIRAHLDSLEDGVAQVIDVYSFEGSGPHCSSRYWSLVVSPVHRPLC